MQFCFGKLITKYIKKDATINNDNTKRQNKTFNFAYYHLSMGHEIISLRKSYVLTHTNALKKSPHQYFMMSFFFITLKVPANLKFSD